jgi:aminotransferase
MGKNKMCIFSNPCNPTGITKVGADLKDFVDRASQPEHGALIDEAYEMFHENPTSALKYVKNIDQTNVMVLGAATKGLQAAGIRIGWVIASRKNVEILGNFGTTSTGGVSHLSQLYCI